MDAPKTLPAAPLVTLELSVVVPTYGRPDAILALLDQLRSQTLEPERFEVVVCDDGTPDPIQLETSDYPFQLTLLRQDNAGPGPARNLAFEHCGAALVLILNDDAVPARDLLAGHLAAHSGADEHTAILGTFRFTEEALRGPFTQVLARTNLLFDFPGLQHRRRYGWQHFWTCNISLQLSAIRAVGGFDPAFDQAIVEDVELGYRLSKNGLQVEYREDLVAEHAHRLEPAEYFARSHRLGRFLARMYAKHDDNEILWAAPDTDIEDYQARSMQSTVEAYSPAVPKLISKLTSIEHEHEGRQLPHAVCQQLAAAVRRLSYAPFAAGALLELEGHDPQVALAEVGARPARVSIVVVSMDACDQTQRCLEALRAQRPDHVDQQILFVDNGSTDGSVEYLRTQSDVELIANASNLGAPRARNQAISRCTGDVVVFLDNDVLVTPGWLERVLWHVTVDGNSGVVGVLSDRAAHGQQIECEPGEAAAHALASARGSDHHRLFRWSVLMPSFCIALRKEVLDVLGGFDEWFSPWGFEDDDFTLRASLAGFRSRVALDVFVRHEPYRGRAKAERHAELLQLNWQRFALRWGAPEGTTYGTVDWIPALLDRGGWERADLHRSPVGQTAGNCVLLWPDYADAEALEACLRDIVRPGELRNLSLALRIDPVLDGGVDAAVEAVEAALERLHEPGTELNVQLLDVPDADEALAQARVLCSAMSASGAGGPRADWVRMSGLEELSR